MMKIISPFFINLAKDKLNAYSKLDKATKVPNGMKCSKYKEVLSRMIEKSRDLFQFDPLVNMHPKNAQK